MTSVITARYASAAEIEAWDELVAGNPAGGDFVQTRPYADTKAAVGWTPRFLVFERGGAGDGSARERASAALVLERRLPLLGRYWYLPHGPAVATAAEAREHTAALRDFLRAHEPRVFAATVEPPIELPEGTAAPDSEVARSLAELGARWRPGIQSNVSTAIVSLAGDDAALLTGFQKRCRNSISRALRDGVEVREYPADAETFAHMHRLMRLVGGGGQALRLRSEEYAERFWSGFSAAGLGRFYGIEVDGSPALLAYVIRVGERAYYKDGGSERPRTSPGMSNLLQWRMMRDMRDEGATSYDLMGTPPRDRLDDPSSPNHTLAAFKLSFAGAVTEFAGAHDLVLRPRAYRAWLRLGLPLAQRLHRRRHRDLDLY
jgi:lipid II:glycine glycyltransferase (peptidoglycan interpeptide bridge formation enzyme)